jgi:hypothetical protein
MNCEQKQSICSTCPRKLNRVCMTWTKVCVGMSCPINAFENPEAMDAYRQKVKIVKAELEKN